MLVAVAIVAAMALLVTPGLSGTTRGATITWTGLGATTNWNLGANWSTGTVPGAADIAVFDGTSAKAAVVTANMSVGGVQVTAAYGGSITQGAGRTITVGTSGWNQAGSSFAGSAAAMTVNGPFSLAGGTFTSTGGTLSVAGDMTVGAGTFAPGGGTLRLFGAAATVDVPGSLAIRNLTLAKAGGVATTLDPADGLIVDGTLTMTNGTWEGGELRARGPISAAAGFDGGTGTLLIDGTSDQVFSGSASSTSGQLPRLVLDKPSGTLTLAGTIRTQQDWTYLGGAVDPVGSTVVFAGTALISGSHALDSVELTGAGAKAIAIGTVLVVNGTLTLSNGALDGGTMSARGPISAAAGFDGGDGTLRVDGAGDQAFIGSATVSSGQLPNLVIDKASGTLSLAGTIRTLRAWTYLVGDLDPGNSTVSFDSGSVIGGSHALANVVLRGAGSTSMAVGDTLTVTGLLSLSNGTWDGGTLLATGDLNQAAGFDGGDGTLRFGGSGAQVFSGSASSTSGQLPALVIDKTSGTLSLAGTIRTQRDWTHLSGALDPGTSTLVVSGAATLSSPGAGLNRLQVRGGTPAVDGELVLAENLVITSGTFDLAGNRVDVAGSVTVSGTLLASGADLEVAGDLLVSGTLVADGSVITLDGSAEQRLDTDGAVLADLIVDGAVGVVLDDHLHVSGTLDLASGTLGLGARRLTIERPIAGTPTNLIAGSSSSLTIAGSTAGIAVPASVSDLDELSIQTEEDVALGAPLSLHARLRLDGGNLDAGTHLVSVLDGATVTRTSGHVIGRLEKPIASGGPLSVQFEIGDATGYAPIVVSWELVSTDGSLTASTQPTDDPVLLATVGLVPPASVNRTWWLTSTDLATDPAEVRMTYLATDLDPGADPTALMAAIVGGGPADLPAVIGRTSTSLTIGVPSIPASGLIGLAMPGSNLGITISGASSVTVDTASPAQVSVTNHGAFTGSASVTLTPDPGTLIVSATPSQGSCSASGTELICALGPIPAGGNVAIDLVVRGTEPGGHQVIASVAASGTSVDPDSTNDVAALSFRASLPSPQPTLAPTAAPTTGPTPTQGPGELPNTAARGDGIDGDVAVTLAALVVLALVAYARITRGQRRLARVRCSRARAPRSHV